MKILRKTASPANLPNVRSYGVLNRSGNASVSALFDARRRANKTQK